MQPKYVDFHAHLDLYPDMAEAMDECDRLSAATLAVTTTPKAFPRNKEWAARRRYVRIGLGLHPQLVAQRHSEIELFEELLPSTRYVGEVGLDASPRHYRSLELQKAIFVRILRACAQEGNKILSVHSVRATSAVLDLVEKHLPRHKGKVVLHWFMGSKSDIRRAVELGCFFSVNEAMLSSDNGQRVLIEIPQDTLLTETDGPFVTRLGDPIRPGDVKQAVHLISESTGDSHDDVRLRVLDNLGRLLS